MHCNSCIQRENDSIVNCPQLVSTEQYRKQPFGWDSIIQWSTAISGISNLRRCPFLGPSGFSVGVIDFGLSSPWWVGNVELEVK